MNLIKLLLRKNGDFLVLMSFQVNEIIVTNEKTFSTVIRRIHVNYMIL